jgi:hypothetical protein
MWLDGRVMPLDLSTEVAKVTGFQHVSFDFMPCGHPRLDVWGTPHWDTHFYTVTQAEKATWMCNMAVYAPICDPADGAQDSSATGQGYFKTEVSLIKS